MVKLKKEEREIPPSLIERFDALGLTQEELEAAADEFGPLDFASLRVELHEIRQVNLKEDPTTVGVAILNKKLAHVQAFKNRVSAIKLQALGSKSEIDAIRRKVELAHNKFSNSVMGEEHIIKLKNVTQQKAAAEEMIPIWLDKLLIEVRDHLANLDLFIKELDCKYGELEDANSNLSRQVTVCQQEVQLMGR